MKKEIKKSNKKIVIFLLIVLVIIVLLITVKIVFFSTRWVDATTLNFHDYWNIGECYYRFAKKVKKSNGKTYFAIVSDIFESNKKKVVEWDDNLIISCEIDGKEVDIYKASNDKIIDRIILYSSIYNKVYCSILNPKYIVSEEELKKAFSDIKYLIINVENRANLENLPNEIKDINFKPNIINFRFKAGKMRIK